MKTEPRNGALNLLYTPARDGALERHYRLTQASLITGYSVAALRKKISRRELGYRKLGRIIAIPESKVARLLGEYRPPILAGAPAAK